MNIVTITDPTQLLMVQIEEIRTGNSQTRNEIQRLRRLLKGGEKEEAKLKAELNKLLSGYQQQMAALAKEG